MGTTTSVAPRLQAAASAYLAEEELADAIVLLDRFVGGATEVEPEIRPICERAAVDVNDRAQVQELLTALSARLSEMTAGRSEAFANALQTYPPEERFSLPALAEALWPAVENLRKAGPGRATSAAIREEIQAHEAQLAALYRRHSGRSEAAWQHTRRALLERLPGMLAADAAFRDAHERGTLRQLAQTPEGVGLICGALGLITLRMPISTPLVSGVLFLVGYAGVAPIIGRVQQHLRTVILQTLRAEDEVIQRLSRGESPLRLTEVTRDAEPIIMAAALGGARTPQEVTAQLEPLLTAVHQAATTPGGPGEAYADAVRQVVLQKLTPRLLGIATRLRETASAPLWRRLLRDPRGAGIATMVATLPISVIAAARTPFGMWDAPLMAAAFYFAGSTATRLLASPQAQLAQLHDAMRSEEALLAGLYAPQAVPGD